MPDAFVGGLGKGAIAASRGLARDAGKSLVLSAEEAGSRLAGAAAKAGAKAAVENPQQVAQAGAKAAIGADKAAVAADAAVAPNTFGPLGRGSTANLSKGTTLPRNLREQLAVEQALSSPTSGSQLPVRMTDPRWPASDGWVKMLQIVQSGGREGPINVHYVYNTITGAIDDLKIVLPGVRQRIAP